MNKFDKKVYDSYSDARKNVIGYPVIIDYGNYQMLMIEKGIGIDVTGESDDEINEKYKKNKDRLDNVKGGKRKSRRNRKSKKGKRSRKSRKSRRKSNRRRGRR